MIEAKNISFKYGIGSKFKVDGLSISVEEGMISCLIGKNGCGKTTVLKLLYGMLTPSAGAVYTDGKKLSGKTLAEYHENTAYVGDKNWCDTSRTLEHNVEMLSILYPSFDREYFDKLLKDAGIKNKADKTVGSFSAGEAVKAEISFALARRPKLLIMDEPLANLDPVYKTDILELLQDAVSANDLGILLSTHLLDEIEDITDKIYIMENGRITKSGDRFEMLGENEDKQLRDLAKG